jgi:hypothetical protein
MNRKILAIAVAIILVSVPLAYALLTVQLTLPASVIINPAGASIQVSDENGAPLNALDFGSTNQQGSTTCKVMITNTGGVTVKLNMTAHNIVLVPPPPGVHGEYLSWNCEGVQLTQGSSVTATFTYSINMMVAGHNVPRTFDVIITATEV